MFQLLLRLASANLFAGRLASHRSRSTTNQGLPQRSGYAARLFCRHFTQEAGFHDLCVQCGLDHADCCSLGGLQVLMLRVIEPAGGGNCRALSGADYHIEICPWPFSDSSSTPGVLISSTTCLADLRDRDLLFTELGVSLGALLTAPLLDFRWWLFERNAGPLTRECLVPSV